MAKISTTLNATDEKYKHKTPNSIKINTKNYKTAKSDFEKTNSHLRTQKIVMNYATNQPSLTHT
jgi:hypothetical protein